MKQDLGFEYFTLREAYRRMSANTETDENQYDGNLSRDVQKFDKIFRECLEILHAKSQDYQNPGSSVRQADYYPRGLETILDEMHKKMLRLRSLIEAERQGYVVNCESLEDNAKDLINYCAIFVAFSRGQIDGQ